MINIPIMQQTVGAQATPTQNVQPLPVSNSIGLALEGLGKATEQLSDAGTNYAVSEKRILEKKAHEDAVAWAGPALSDFQLGWTQTANARRAGTQPGTQAFADFIPTMLAEYDKGAAQLVQNAPTPAAKRLLDASLASFRTQMGEQSIAWMHQQDTAHKISSNETTIDNNAKLAAADPKRAGEYYDTTAALINNSGLDQQFRDALTEKLRHTMANGAAASLAMTNPQALYSTLERGTFPGGGNPRMLSGNINPAYGGDVGLPPKIAQIAKEEGVDPRLVAAVYSQESSSGANTATSGDGAVGPFQVIPATFKRMMGGKGDINNPDDNARAGIRYLAKLSAIAGGDPAVTAAGYFSGEDNIRGGRIINADLRDLGGKGKTTVGAYAASVKAKFDAFGAPAASNTAAVGVTDAVDANTPAITGSTGNPILDKLTIPERLHWMEFATGQARQGVAADQATFRQRVNDEMAAAKNGTVSQTPIAPSEFTRQLGAQMGPVAYREYVGAQEFGKNITSFKTLNDADISRVLTTMDPQGQESTDGYANRLELFHGAQNAAAQVIKQRNDEPAAFAMQNSPVVQQAFHALQTLPANANDAQRAAAANAYATATIGVQRSMSIADPKLLSTSQVEDVALQFHKQPGGPEGLVAMVQSEAAKWGPFWPQVAQEIAKKVPSSVLVLASGLPKDTAVRVASLASQKLESLQEGLPKEMPTQIKDKVTSALEPFRASLLTTDPRSGSQTFDAVFQAVLKDATYLVSAQNLSPVKAAERSAAEFINDKYNFADTWRAPKSFDFDKIRSTAAMVQHNLDPKLLDLPPNAPGDNPEMTRNLYAGSVKDYGYWATDKSEQGLILKMQGTTVMRGGKPIFYPFGDLEMVGPRTLFGTTIPDRYGAYPAGAAPGMPGVRVPTRSTTPLVEAPGGAAIVYPKAGLGTSGSAP